MYFWFYIGYMAEEKPCFPRLEVEIIQTFKAKGMSKWFLLGGE